MMRKMYEPKDIAVITGLDKQEMRKLLHDYEDIVKPTDYKNYPPSGKGGYKRYDADAVDKVQQIVIYRELGLSHSEINDIFSDPAYDSNQTLNGLLTSLKEKRERINRQIEAVEFMQAIGVKNGILQFILPNGSIEGLFGERNLSAVNRVNVMVDTMIEDLKADDARIEDFFSQIEPVCAAYAQLDDSLCENLEGTVLIENIVSILKQEFGFWGYSICLIIALSVSGEGTILQEIQDSLGISFSIQKYRSFAQWILNDFKNFDTEIRDLARQYHCIGLPFHHDRSIRFVTDVRAAAQEHFALQTDEEYMLIFSSMNIPPYKFGDGYALYTLNAIKCGINT